MAGPLVWALVASAALSPSRVHAQAAATAAPAAPEAGVGDAQQAFKRGLKAYAEQRWLEAVEALSRAVALEPHPAALLNLALAHFRAGQHASALEALDRFEALDDARKDEGRLAKAKWLRERALAHVAVLRVELAPAQASLQVDDRALPASAVAYLTPGTYRVRAGADGYEPRTESLVLLAGGTVTLRWRLSARSVSPREPAGAGPSRAPPSPSEVARGAAASSLARPGPARFSEGKGRRWRWWVTAGALVAAALGGTLTWALVDRDGAAPRPYRGTSGVTLGPASPAPPE